MDKPVCGEKGDDIERRRITISRRQLVWLVSGPEMNHLNVTKAAIENLEALWKAQCIWRSATLMGISRIRLGP